MHKISLSHPLIRLTAILLLLPLVGCALSEPPPMPHPTMVLQAVGFGTVRPDKGLTVNQMKLMAMRASRMDAYRNLTEQVYGIQIAGTTSVGAMVVENDSYKGFINGYMHGAKMTRQEPLGDNYSYETHLELEVSDDFYEQSNRLLAATPSPASISPAAGGVSHSDRYYYNSR